MSDRYSKREQFFMADAEMENRIDLENEYGADQIQILEGLEAVRREKDLECTLEVHLRRTSSSGIWCR